MIFGEIRNFYSKTWKPIVQYCEAKKMLQKPEVSKHCSRIQPWPKVGMMPLPYYYYSLVIEFLKLYLLVDKAIIISQDM